MTARATIAVAAAGAVLGLVAVGCRDRPAPAEERAGAAPATAPGPGASPGALSTLVGTLRSVGPAEIVVEVDGAAVPFELHEGVMITREGEVADRAALREGESVRAVFNPAPAGAPAWQRELVRLELAPDRAERR